VSDLDDAEIARLVVLAEKDARELLATQGYFRPQVRIAREPGQRTTLVVTWSRASAPWSGGELEFEGDIAGSTDPQPRSARRSAGLGLPSGSPSPRPMGRGEVRRHARAAGQALSRRAHQLQPGRRRCRDRLGAPGPAPGLGRAVPPRAR
jgi:hypothetical protein